MSQSRCYAPRAADDAVLDILRRWYAGEDSPTIGKRHGLSASAVRTIIARVKADLAKSEAS